MIDPAFDHRVKIPFKTTRFDVVGRIIELNQLREWLDELVEWQPAQYSINIYGSGPIINVWFREEHHAVWCTLRWA